MSNFYIGTKKPINIYTGLSTVNKVYLGLEEVWSKSNCLCFTAKAPGSTIKIKCKDTVYSRDFKISTDGKTWTSYQILYSEGSLITLSNVGDKVYFKGNNPSGLNTHSGYYYFIMTGSISASGNIMALLDDGACNTTVIPNSDCFWNLFRNCTALTTPPELPATTLKTACYSSLFSGCTSLVKAPSLPATAMVSYCYQTMFYGCTSLVTVPKLPATYFPYYTYLSMFNGCTSLIVSDTPGAGYDKAWRLPTSGTFTTSAEQDYMFVNCAGTRSSNTFYPVSGQSTTYYTQNEPV